MAGSAMRMSMRSAQPARTAAMGTTGSGDPDMILIGELMEDISRNPPATAARKLLVEHYISVGWLDAALENAKDLNNLIPNDADVAKYLHVLERAPEPPAQEMVPVLVSSAPVTETLEWDVQSGRYRKKAGPKHHKNKNVKLPPVDPNIDLDTGRQDLTKGYLALRAKAKHVLSDLLHLQTLQRKANLPQSKDTTRVAAIAHEQKEAPSTTVKPPASARSVARVIRDNAEEATNLIITDLERTMDWTRAPYGKASNADNDTIRDALVKRKNELSDALPEGMKVYCELSFMHIEHESLERNYANTETMLGDDVKDIPRDDFYVTEDNYAWSMDELVQAIRANSGVLRNPLSKSMFTPNDIKGILMHPLGKPLAALAVEQHEMSKGVRVATIEEMEKLAKILLEDQSSDTVPSRKAVDEFLAYIATLPDLEQKAIDGLRCPAKDSHTGQSYDFSIGESVRDARGNRVCFHKTGDFIGQAAAHLRQSRGATLDSDKCVVM